VVFPFDFAEQGWEVLARFVTWVAVIGTIIALFVNTVLLVRWIVRRPAV